MNGEFLVAGRGFDGKVGCGSSLAGSVGRGDGKNAGILGIWISDGQGVAVSLGRNDKIAGRLNLHPFAKPPDNGQRRTRDGYRKAHRVALPYCLTL